MKQLTKRAYTRKAIIIGSIAFSLIALTATGVAAFVLSASAESTPAGGLHVGIVSTKAITIKVEDMDPEGKMQGDYVIDFDPKEDDTSGRIRWDNHNYERLSCAVSGTINPGTVVKTSTVSAKLTMGNYDTSTSTWNDDATMMSNFKNAAAGDNPFITLPKCFDNEVELSTDPNNNDYLLVFDDSNDKCDFSIKFAFGWGSFFNYMNPGNYYDEDSTGITKTDTEMADEMSAFSAALFGNKDMESDLQIDYKLTIRVDTSTSNTTTTTY